MNWQPIETCPKPPKTGEYSIPFLVWDGDNIVVATCFSYTNTHKLFCVADSYGFNEDGEIPNPTHWMPLPEPPK
jgi:hypothetical protein